MYEITYSLTYECNPGTFFTRFHEYCEFDILLCSHTVFIVILDGAMVACFVPAESLILTNH